MKPPRVTTPSSSETPKGPPMKTPSVKLLAAFVMLPLLLLCAGCAARSPASTAAPIPTRQETPALPPALAKPAPPESYSDKAAARIKSWQQTLTDSATR